MNIESQLQKKDKNLEILLEGGKFEMILLYLEFQIVTQKRRKQERKKKNSD